MSETITLLQIALSLHPLILAKVLSDEPRFYPGTVEMIARGGPKWEPGTKVDVVIRLPSKDSKEVYFLKLINQEIQRTS